MATNEELYFDAKRRYNNACYSINDCTNKIGSLKSDKQSTINEINRLQTLIQKNEKALEQVQDISKKEADLNARLQTIATKTDAAAVNFSAMVSSSSVTNKNLSDVYGQEREQTRQKLGEIMETIRAKMKLLAQKLEEFRNKLQAAQETLEQIKQQIRSRESDLADYKRVRNNASYDMTYYRRKLEEEGYSGRF